MGARLVSVERMCWRYDHRLKRRRRWVRWPDCYCCRGTGLYNLDPGTGAHADAACPCGEWGRDDAPPHVSGYPSR